MQLRRFLLSIVILVIVSPSLAAIAPILNSDAIRATFGSYGVAIISQTKTTRVVNLFSGTGDSAVCRTLAVTEFVLPTDAALLASHTRIRDGASIGATLRAAGFLIKKKLLIDTQLPASDAFAQLAQHSIATGTLLDTKVYVLFAAKHGRDIPYAVIAEAYHPAHRPPPDAGVVAVPELLETARQTLKTLQRVSL